MTAPVIMVREWDKSFSADEAGFKEFTAFALQKVQNAQDIHALSLDAETWYGNFEIFENNMGWSHEQKMEAFTPVGTAFENRYKDLTGRDASSVSWPWAFKHGDPGYMQKIAPPGSGIFNTLLNGWRGLPPLAKAGVVAGGVLVVSSILFGGSRK